MAKQMMYPIIAAEYDDEDGHYFVATSPNIPGMVTQGATLTDLREQADDAIATMLEGEVIPEPQDPSAWTLAANERVVYVTVSLRD